MKQLAQGIASLGRGKDKMLVHMTPGEVAGLQRIAMAHGGSLTINPQTGLAEAGFLSDLLGFAAPIVGGMMFGPIGAGLASGLTSYAREGDMGKALGAGALGWGGASLLGGLEGVGGDALSEATRTAAQNSGQDFVTNEALQNATIAPEITLPQSYPDELVGDTSVFRTADPFAQPEFGSNPYALNGNPQYSLDPAATGETTRNLAYSGTPDITTPAMPSYTDKLGAGFKQVTSSGKNAMDFLSNNKLPLAATALGISSMMTPKQAAPAAPKLQGTRQDYAYDQPRYDASGRLISAPSYRQIGSTPYYGAEGGEVPGFAAGVYIPQSKSIRTDIYGSNAGPIGESGKQMYKNTDKYAGLKAQLDKMSPSMLSRLSKGGTDSIVQAAATTELYDRANNPNPAYMDQPTMQAAQGGIMGFDIGGSVTAHEAPQFTFNPANQTYAQQAPASQGSGNPFADAPSQILRALGGQFSEPAAKQYTYDPSGQTYTEKMAAGGIASLPNEYAAGGKLLQGPGDGMSDSIPAVIKGDRPQRAALAQGEFVIPADVVSHLGNGSTDAGSKRLYAMMDKIRHARTGTKKQGRQINPNQFLPA